MTKFKVVQIDEMQNFMLSCLKTVGAKESHANDLIDALIQADIRNHLSHGLNRLELYLDDFKLKSCNSDHEPEIIKENMCTAWVDGKNVLGPRVGKFCMNLAIQKAKKTGMAMVVCKASNHFGINQFYSLMAAEEKLIGMAFTNGSPLVASARGKKPFLSTNPLSCAAKTENTTFILDMATSVVSLGKVELQERKGEKIPSNWAIDKDGNLTTDPKEVHALLPLGGLMETSGYKGFGLGIMTELFTSILSNADSSPHLRKWSQRERIANVGHAFIAIDPKCFSPDFEDNLDKFANDVRSQEPSDPKQPVLLPGDPEMDRVQLVSKLNGIPYFEKQIQFADDLALKLNVPKVKILKEIDLDI